MTRLARYGLLLVLALLLTACAGEDDVGVGDQPAADPTASTPGEPSQSAADTAPQQSASARPSTATEVTGTLGGSAIEGGCIWLDAADGTRYELVTVPGTQVAIDPQNRVIATLDGEVIAEDGDEVTITGVTDPGLMTFCQVGEILAVQDAEAA